MSTPVDLPSREEMPGILDQIGSYLPYTNFWSFFNFVALTFFFVVFIGSSSDVDTRWVSLGLIPIWALGVLLSCSAHVLYRRFWRLETERLSSIKERILCASSVRFFNSIGIAYVTFLFLIHFNLHLMQRSNPISMEDVWLLLLLLLAGVQFSFIGMLAWLHVLGERFLSARIRTVSMVVFRVQGLALGAGILWVMTRAVPVFSETWTVTVSGLGWTIGSMLVLLFALAAVSLSTYVVLLMPKATLIWFYNWQIGLQHTQLVSNRALGKRLATVHDWPDEWPEQKTDAPYMAHPSI